MRDPLLSPIPDVLLDGLTKGLPSDLPPTPMATIADLGWNALGGDLPTPLAVLDVEAIEQNSRWFRAVTSAYGVALCPHGKTTMAPQLFAKQLAEGAWGITLATQHQAAVARRFGVRRIFIANQVLDPAFLRWIAREQAADPEFDVYFLIDGPEGVAGLRRVAEETSRHRPFNVLIEIGSAKGRTGVRSQAEALSLAAEIARWPEAARLCGIEGFEGAMRGPDQASIEADVMAFLDLMVATAEACEAAGHFSGPEILLTAGGSSFFDLVARRLTTHRLRGAARVVLRSGCYISHDGRLYAESVRRAMERSPELAALNERPRQALTVWAMVQSRPEPGLFYVNAGRRDLSSDAHLPEVLAYSPDGATVMEVDPARHRTTLMWDQHACIACPEDSPIRPGMKVRLGISHPCTTFDKWAAILMTDGTQNVVGALKTYF